MAICSRFHRVEAGLPPGARCSRTVAHSPLPAVPHQPRPQLQFCYVPEHLVNAAIQLIDEFVFRSASLPYGALLSGLRLPTQPRSHPRSRGRADLSVPQPVTPPSYRRHRRPHSAPPPSTAAPHQQTVSAATRRIGARVAADLRSHRSEPPRPRHAMQSQRARPPQQHQSQTEAHPQQQWPPQHSQGVDPPWRSTRGPARTRPPAQPHVLQHRPMTTDSNIVPTNRDQRRAAISRVLGGLLDALEE